MGVRCLMERIDHAAFLTSVSCVLHSECPLQKVLATKEFKLGPKTNDIFPKNGQKKVLQSFLSCYQKIGTNYLIIPLESTFGWGWRCVFILFILFYAFLLGCQFYLFA